jgi:hypothetical protein
MTEVSREGRRGSQQLADNVPGCPEWCIRHDVEPDDGSAIHYGPSFGHFEPSAAVLADGTTCEFGMSIIGAASLDDLDDMTPEQLRQLAADALAAADWLEHGDADWPRAVTSALAKVLEARS